MELIDFGKVIIAADRIRKAGSAERNAELAQSLREVGLLHLPVLRKTTEGLVLVSGFRRFTAINYLNDLGEEIKYIGRRVPIGMLPYVAFESLSDEQALEIELQENTVREDLSWQDRIAATARLHAMYKARDPHWANKDTGTEIGVTANTVNERLVLAEHLSDPDVVAAKTEGEAFKVVKKKMENMFREGLSQTVAAPAIDLRQGDSRDLIKTLPDNSVHIFLTDPPYGIDAGSFGVGEAHTYQDSAEYFKVLMTEMLELMFKKAAAQSHLFLFCDVLHFPWLRSVANSVGWTTWNFPFIWVKDTGHIPDANLGPRHNYECVLMATKGKRPITKLVSDVIEIAADKDKRHPAQKPIDLYRFFLTLSSVPGDTVCDPFCGSGTIFLAAQPYRVTTIGFEFDPETVKIAKSRWTEGK